MISLDDLAINWWMKGGQFTGHRGNNLADLTMHCAMVDLIIWQVVGLNPNHIDAFTNRSIDSLLFHPHGSPLPAR
jgi:hypothetical protein